MTMATMPMTPRAGAALRSDPMADPTSTGLPAIAQDDPGEAAGFTVCINLSDDNEYSVGEDGGSMQPAADLKDALTIAMQLLRTRGASGEKAAEDDFSGAFASRAGSMSEGDAL